MLPFQSLHRTLLVHARAVAVAENPLFSPQVDLTAARQYTSARFKTKIASRAKTCTEFRQMNLPRRPNLLSPTTPAFPIQFRRSSKMALPMAPAAQEATSASSPFSCCNRRAAVVTRRAPVAPKGWPRDSEPPQRFSFSRGISPTARSRPRRSFANRSEASSFKLASTCAANAS